MNRELFMAACDNGVDDWLPANGGTETPFKTLLGFRLLYCFNPAERRHAFLDLDRDIILTTEEYLAAVGH